jgi:hypothetical protein
MKTSLLMIKFQEQRVYNHYHESANANKSVRSVQLGGLRTPFPRNQARNSSPVISTFPKSLLRDTTVLIGSPTPAFRRLRTRFICYERIRLTCEKK